MPSSVRLGAEIPAPSLDEVGNVLRALLMPHALHLGPSSRTLGRAPVDNEFELE